ncbi:MAG: hypothetical protein ACLP50_35490 [Solirubrobacteraceae bacterium]
MRSAAASSSPDRTPGVVRSGSKSFLIDRKQRSLGAAATLASMNTSSELGAARTSRRRARSWTRTRHATSRITGGGTAGNEQLTTITGTVLLVLLAVIAITILRIGQLISMHMFVGLLLIGPVTLKLASTGYRFARYYTRDAAYHRKGPPELLLRLIAPIVMLSTVAVFASGVALLFAGPAGRGQLLLIHKASFILWIVFTSLHVLGHLPHVPASLRSVRRANPDLPGVGPGAAGRWIAIGGALVGGLVLAIALLPDFAVWTAHAALWQHRH